MAKKKAKEIQEELLGSAHKVWLAGLGALSMAEEESGKLFKSLIKRGEDVEKRGKDRVDKAMETVSGVKTVAESYWETFEGVVDDKVTAVIHRLGVPTKDEIEDLTKKVEDLTQSIDKLRSKEAKPAAKSKAK
jgi:poly(hydroxyalkanoate) granule-associated protein